MRLKAGPGRDEWYPYHMFFIDADVHQMVLMSLIRWNIIKKGFIFSLDQSLALWICGWSNSIILRKVKSRSLERYHQVSPLALWSVLSEWFDPIILFSFGQRFSMAGWLWGEMDKCAVWLLKYCQLSDPLYVFYVFDSISFGASEEWRISGIQKGNWKMRISIF